jgi:RNA polymerase sigma factor (sigma-70 family)
LVLTRDPHEAEDIVQEVMVRMTERLAELPTAERGPYLRTAVVNEWRSRLRRLRVRASKTGVLATSDPGGVDRDTSVDLWALVKRLPPRQRATLVLRYYEDLTEAETAATLGCSIGTVKSQLHHAIARLREDYRDDAQRR